ncbi:MAG TPA: transglycosylase domain-containing protein [Candidatus Dormibacteraeota bacterium]|nr:transglycosylase domain-containing protein [Candidatus Dormibacteraeota bacterium]
MQEITVTPRERASRRTGLRRRSGLQRPPKPGFWTRHRWLRNWATIGLVGVLVACAGVGSGMIVLAAFQVGLPSVSALPNLGPPNDSQILASDGSLLAILHEPGVHHVGVGLKQVSPLLVQATVAVEDRHFYQDTASADLPRIVESGVNDLLHHSQLQGASTITEQLAKISFLTPQKTITRKIRELLLGYEISKVFKPNSILQMYVNRINYGNQAIGIESAAELYFHIPASKLDLAQASLLAGIPDAPTAYNPILYQGVTGVANLAKDRQEVVLQAMVRNGYVTQKQANVAFKETLTLYPWQASEVDTQPDFVQFAVSQLQAQFGDAYLNPGGWTIYTSLNTTDQAAGIADLQNPTKDAMLQRDFNIGDADLESVDPRTGEILAMVGTTDPSGQWGQINMVDSPRRTGSSFKMFTYTAALVSGKFTMTTPILNEPININGYAPVNYSRTYTGICQLKFCLGNSINVPAVKVEDITGLQNVVDVAEKMGLTGLLNPQNTYGLALTLGGAAIGFTMINMSTGASVLASGGVLHQPTTILTILQGKKMIYQYNVAQNSQQVIPANVAYIMNMILQSNQNRQPEFGIDNGLTIPNRIVAVKTGTSDYGVGDLAGIGDNWVFGWTPTLLTATWVGNPNYATLSAVSSGITGAAPLWQTYMEQVLPAQPDIWYTKPADVVQVGSGLNANFYLPNTVAYANQDVNCPGAYSRLWNGNC